MGLLELLWGNYLVLKYHRYVQWMTCVHYLAMYLFYLIMYPFTECNGIWSYDDRAVTTVSREQIQYS